MAGLESVEARDFGTMIVVRAIGWKVARSTLLALPMGSPEFLKYINALSECEDELNKAVTALMEVQQHD